MTHLTPQNFTMVSGDDKVIRVTITDDGTATGEVIDLTGLKSAIWKLARSVRSAPLVKKTLTPDDLYVNPDPGGIVVTNAVGGVLEITLLPVDTDALSRDYYHELQIQDALNNRRTVMVGTISIDPDLVTE